MEKVQQVSEQIDKYKGQVIILGIIFLTTFFVPKEDFFFRGTLLCGIMIYKIWHSKYRLSLIDKCVIAIGIFEFVSVFTSINPLNTFSNLQNTLLSIFFYFILRTTLINNKRRKFLLLIYTGIISLLEIVALCSFWIYRNNIVDVGFDDLYAFRFLYTPLGIFSNIWANLQILFLGILALTAYYYKENKKVFFFSLGICFIVLFEIITSFSRGIYISMAILVIIITCYILLSFAKYFHKILYLFLLIGSISLLSLPFHAECRKAIQMNETVSQQKSIESRKNSMVNSLNLIKQKPLLGIGEGAYLLGLNSYLYEDDNNSITLYAPNLITQLLVEKGIIGILLYSSLFILIIIYFFRNRNKETFIIIVTLFILLVREQTFTIFFYSLPAKIIVFTLLAFLQKEVNVEKMKDKEKKKYNLFVLFPVFACITILSGNILSHKNAKHTQNFMESMKKGDMETAEMEIEKTTPFVPHLVNKALFYYIKYKDCSSKNAIVEAEKYIRLAIQCNSLDIHLNYYLSQILIQKGEYEEASGILSGLTQKYHNNTIYHWGFFNLYKRLDNPEKAAIELTKCIELSPGILETQQWKTLCLQNPELTDSVLLNLKELVINFTSSDAIINAKYGAIAMYLNNSELAEELLLKAITILPNLSRPWSNLSKIYTQRGEIDKAFLSKKRAYILEYGAFLPSQILDKHIQERDDNLFGKFQITDLLGRYRTKFYIWYDTSLFCHEKIIMH